MENQYQSESRCLMYPRRPHGPDEKSILAQGLSLSGADGTWRQSRENEKTFGTERPMMGLHLAERGIE